MTQSVKKKSKTKNTTAPVTTSGGSNVPMYTFEIRKFVRAPNIVEAFNMDVETPPTYIVATEKEDTEGEEVTAIGFNEG